jgi:hypothetical protein
MRGALAVAACALAFAACSMLGGVSQGLCFNGTSMIAPAGLAGPAVPVISRTCLTAPGGK